MYYLWKYLYTKEGLYCADIVTFNTIKLKGAFTDIARAYGLDLKEVRDVTSNLEGNEEKAIEVHNRMVQCNRNALQLFYDNLSTTWTTYNCFSNRTFIEFELC